MTSRLVTTGQVENPEGVGLSVTFTMSISDWMILVEFLRDTKESWKFPMNAMRTEVLDLICILSKQVKLEAEEDA